MNEPVRALLVRLAEQFDDLGATWVVSGSAALVLHGLHGIEPDDIDIESDRLGALRMGERLSAAICLRPVVFGETDLVRSWFGRYELDGVTVEVIGDMQILDGAAWSAPFAVGGRWDRVDVGGWPVPVASLTALSRQYRLLRRPDRVAQIEAHLTGDEPARPSRRARPGATS